jgi:hypothetical protein
VLAYDLPDDVSERNHPIRWAARAKQLQLQLQRTSKAFGIADTNMPFTSCQYTAVDGSQQWTLDGSRLRNGNQCLGRVRNAIVVTSDCADQTSEWLMAGVNQRLTQLRVADNAEVDDLWTFGWKEADSCLLSCSNAWLSTPQRSIWNHASRNLTIAIQHAVQTVLW